MSAVKRKKRSEDLLKSLAIPIRRDLPPLDKFCECKLRSESEVGARVVCLQQVIEVAQGNNATPRVEYLKQNKLWDFCSGKEQAFLTATEPETYQMSNALWRVESEYFLLWAIGYVNYLPLPTSPVDTDLFLPTVPSLPRNPTGFIAEGSLRKKEDILDQVDFIYRLFWAVKDMELKKPQTPYSINVKVLEEWNYAGSWLVKLNQRCWDDLPSTRL